MNKTLLLSLILIPALMLVGCPSDDDDDAGTTVGTSMIAVGEETGGTGAVILTTTNMTTWTKINPESTAGVTNADWTGMVNEATLVKKFKIGATFNRYFIVGTQSNVGDDVSTIWYSDTPTDPLSWLKATINFYNGDEPAIVDMAITAVDEVNNTFTVAGDQVAIFIPGRTFTVTTSTENDGTFTIATAVLTGSDTVITVDETVVADAAGLGVINDAAYTHFADHQENPMIYDMLMVTETIGFAVGEDALFLYTIDGGVTWNEGNLREDTNDNGTYDQWINDFGTGYTLAVKSVASLGHFVLIGSSDGIWMVAIADADIATPAPANWHWTDNTDMAGASTNLDYDEIVSIYLHESGTDLYVLAMSDDPYHFLLTLPTAIDGAPTIGAVTEHNLTGSYAVSNYIMVTKGTTTFLYYASWSDYIYRIDISNLGATYATTDWEEVTASANNYLGSSYVVSGDENRQVLTYKNNVAYLLDDSSTTGDWGYGIGLGSTLGTTPENEFWFDNDDDPLPDNLITDTGYERIETLTTGQTAGTGTVYDLYSWIVIE